MKKSSLLLLLLLLSATVIADTNFPFIPREKDNSGKYGFVYGGKEILPHIFDAARAFKENEVMTSVSFYKEHFVIDRKGRLVGGGYENSPEIFPKFAIVATLQKQGLNSNAGIVIDCNGKRLIPNYYAQAITLSAADKLSYNLFVVSKDRKEYSGRHLDRWRRFGREHFPSCRQENRLPFAGERCNCYRLQ